jgi:hypothetical protein
MSRTVNPLRCHGPLSILHCPLAEAAAAGRMVTLMLAARMAGESTASERRAAQRNDCMAIGRKLDSGGKGRRVPGVRF